jgi:hypothetical protein
LIGGLGGYGTIRPEQRYGENSRIDFLLSEPGRADAYVEVKNVHSAAPRRLGGVSRLRDRARAPSIWRNCRRIARGRGAGGSTRMVEDAGATSATIGYKGYQHASCIS